MVSFTNLNQTWQSGFRQANDLMLESAADVLSGDPDRLVGGIAGMRMAALQVRAAAAVGRTEDETRRSLLDIWA